jgi:hypothetical protein
LRLSIYAFTTAQQQLAHLLTLRLRTLGLVQLAAKQHLVDSACRALFLRLLASHDALAKCLAQAGALGRPATGLQQLSRHRQHTLALNSFLLLRSQEVIHATGVTAKQVEARAASAAGKVIHESSHDVPLTEKTEQTAADGTHAAWEHHVASHRTTKSTSRRVAINRSLARPAQVGRVQADCTLHQAQTLQIQIALCVKLLLCELLTGTTQTHEGLAGCVLAGSLLLTQATQLAGRTHAELSALHTC